MLNLFLKQLVRNHWRAMLLGTASVTLSACVATDTGSSSSTESSSSVAVQPSSSSQAVSSSVEASSSVAPSSSSVVPVSSSSSIAPSSSSVASSSADNCEEPDTAQFDRGMTVYGTDCSACHGQPVAGKTTGGLLAEIVVDSPPYGKTNDNSLAGYIISNMSNHLSSCTNSATECAADIEHYLMVATGQLAIAQAECSSSSEAISSSAPSSSIASSSSAPSGTCSDATFCEDFEGGLSAWGTSGEVSLSTEKVFEGASALKVAAQGGGYNRNFISLDLANTGLQSNMYGRMMLNVNTPSGNGGDFVFVQAEGAPDSANSNAPAGTNVMYRYRVNGSDGNLMANYDTYNNSATWSTDCWDHSTVKMPTNQWACLEWHFDRDANELKFWLDGTELTELHVQSSGEGCLGTAENGIWQAPAKFNTLHLGIEQYHNGVPARTMYIDDVKVDTQYIGCPGMAPPSSSSSSSSATTGSSSSSPTTSAALSCDFDVTQDGGYYFEVKPITITNSGSTTVTNWSVDIDLGSTSGSNLQIYARNGVSDATLAGSILTVSGPSLAAGASATIEFGMNFSNHMVGMPSCESQGGGNSEGNQSSATSSSVAPPPPPPTGTGPVANGQCAANTGLGNGSAAKEAANVVLNDGTAVHVKGGVASAMKYTNGTNVTSAIAVNGGDYAGSGACVALASGAIHCGAYSAISTTASATVNNVVYMTTGSDINNSFCALTSDGDLTCSAAADAGMGGAKPYSYAHCGRLGCCAIDANDEIQCTDLDPSIQPSGTPLILGASDYGYCTITDEAKSYCWLTQDFQGVNAGGLLFSPQSNPVVATPLSEPVISYAGGQFHSCWVTSNGGVLCSGGGNTANGAAGESAGADVAEIKTSSGPLRNVVAVNGGRGSACAVNTSGDLYCWGSTGGNGGTAVKIDLGSKKVRMPEDCMQ